VYKLLADTEIETDLETLEKRLQESIQGGHPELARMSGHIIFSGGKRLRPALGIMVYKALGGRAVDSLIPVSVALELIHTATLIHDDIIDSSSLRRGAPSVHQMFGKEKALITGDFLFAKAYGMCSRYGSRIIEIAADACVRLAEGEIMQMNMTLEDITVTKYIEIITRKTADLFSAGTKVATILAEAPEEHMETTGYFGHHLGLAFQIIDDYLDLVGDENIGKPRGLDVKEGTPTLPVIRARYQMGDKDAQRLIAIYKKKKRTDKDVSKVLKLVEDTDGLQYTKNMARERADLAIKELEKLPQNNYIDLLKKVTDFVVERDQ
jgi:geranylgeranyl pyrophosphate synthase